MENHNSKVDELQAELQDGTDPIHDIGLQGFFVEFARVAARTDGCTICEGMTADLSTGKLYCGVKTPIEITESNRKIETS